MKRGSDFPFSFFIRNAIMKNKNLDSFRRAVMKESIMKIEFDVQIDHKDLFGFNIRQTYLSSQGIISILIGILCLVMAGAQFGEGNIGYGIMYVVIAIVIVAYIPGTLWLRAKSTMKVNTVLSGVLHYSFDEKGVTVTQGEEEGVLPWESVYKMIATKKHVLIYSNRVNAYIIPKAQISQMDELVKLAKAQLDSYRLGKSLSR